MAKKQPTSSTARNHAANVAFGTLALLAAVQVGLVANAVWKNDADQTRSEADKLAAATTARRLAVVPKAPAPKPAAPLPAAPASPSPAPVTTSTALSSASDLPPRDPAALLQMSGIGTSAPAAPLSTASSVPSALPPAPAAVASASPAPAVARPPTLPAGKELTDPKVAQMVESARQVRRSGDIQAAIQALKAADVMKPNHPEILSELALTYEALGLSDKSQSAWSRVRAMGEKGAGGYYRLAAAKLEGAEAADATPAVQAITLGECSISKQDTKTVLHMPMIVTPGQTLNANAMDIQVFFFEADANGHVDRAPAERSGAPRWAGAEPSWEPGKPEVLELDYTPPTPSTNAKLQYHGYMVKLYYKDNLMGEQADPPALLKYRPQQPGTAGADNALLPPIK